MNKKISPRQYLYGKLVAMSLQEGLVCEISSAYPNADEIVLNMIPNLPFKRGMRSSKLYSTNLRINIAHVDSKEDAREILKGIRYMYWGDQLNQE